MSSFSTTINNNIYSNLNSSQKMTNKKILRTNATETNCVCSLKGTKIKNLYNKIDYQNLKGLKKYENFRIFSLREKEFDKRKRKLKPRIRKNKSISTKPVLSYNSIYITQNLSEGNFQDLPKILTKISLNDEKIKKNINNDRNKHNKIIEKKEIFTKIEKNIPVRNQYLNKLKNSIEKKNETEGKINKKERDNNLFKKKISNLNLYRKNDNYYLTYIDNLHDYLNKKKMYSLRKERFLRFEEINRNKIESVGEQIHSMQRSQQLLEKKFIIKYQEYVSSLYREKDKQDKKDIIICDKLYEVRKEVKTLEKKIQKLLFERNTYIKWLLFQVQVHDKLLKLPKKYNDFLRAENKKKLPDELIKYKINIIFPTPEELINRIDYYENLNIKSLEIYHKMTLEVYPLKDELENQIANFERISDTEEINKLKEIKVKLKIKKDILTKKINNLRIELNILPKKFSIKKKHSKLYEKIKIIRNNITITKMDYKDIQDENLKMLRMLKEIELEIDFQKKKHKLYQVKFKQSLLKEKEKIEKEKRIEKIRINKKLEEERKYQLQKSIVEKINKRFILPNMKINWNVYNLKKDKKSSINININKDDKKENINEYLIYQ